MKLSQKSFITAFITLGMSFLFGNLAVYVTNGMQLWYMFFSIITGFVSVILFTGSLAEYFNE